MSVKTIFLSKQSTVNGKKAYATGDVALNLKEYITAIIDENTPSVNNGLSITSGNIGLGGTLVRNTDIATTTYQFKLGKTTSGTFEGLNINSGLTSYPNYFGTADRNFYSRASTNALGLINKTSGTLFTQVYTLPNFISMETVDNGRYCNLTCSKDDLILQGLDNPSGGVTKFIRINNTSNYITMGSAGTILIKLERDTQSKITLDVPTYANNAAALAGGLTAGMIYKTSTGELRITV